MKQNQLKNAMDDIDNIKNLKKLFARKSLLDVAIQVEKFLDSMNIYVYPNWIEGQLVQGPDLNKYWVSIILKYDYKEMPDPRAAVVLSNVGVIVNYEHTKEMIPVTVRTPDDFRPGTKKPKLEEHDIWLITLQIPRRVIDEAELDDLDLVDDEVDTEDVSDAEDYGLESDGME